MIAAAIGMNTPAVAVILKIPVSGDIANDTDPTVAIL
jgi:hypothetical protein